MYSRGFLGSRNLGAQGLHGGIRQRENPALFAGPPQAPPQAALRAAPQELETWTWQTDFGTFGVGVGGERRTTTVLLTDAAGARGAVVAKEGSVQSPTQPTFVKACPRMVMQGGA